LYARWILAKNKIRIYTGGSEYTTPLPKLPIAFCLTAYYNNVMLTYPKSISFRPWPDAADAILKILAAHTGQLPALNQSDAINKAQIEYAKTLPDPQPIPLDPPKESAPMKD
jgi:hypothetical protein